MTRTTLFVAMTALYLILSAVSAQTISQIQLNITSSGMAFVTEEFTISGSEPSVELFIPVHKNLQIMSAGIGIPYTSRNVEGGFIISPDQQNIPAGGVKDMTLNYETQYLTSKNGSLWSVSFRTKATPRKTIIKLHLPSNSTILPPSPPDVLFSVDRDSLWLYPQTDEFNFTCNYEYAGGPAVLPKDVPEINVVVAIILTAVIIITAVVAIAIVYHLIRKRMASSKSVGKVEIEKDVVHSEPVASGEHKKTDLGEIEFEFKTERNNASIKQTVLNVLDDEEKNIVSFIQEHGPDDVTQAFIYKTTRMPKSSLSEVIKRLEKRNVLECRRQGRVNWIKLKKWVFD
ncbi:MAG: hypothetical protein PHG85_03435 [Candidatus Altiarchaeota archaeon]|nr:hypothetical protein [Candidatus Altiarchaeota archaeon]